MVLDHRSCDVIYSFNSGYSILLKGKQIWPNRVPPNCFQLEELSKDAPLLHVSGRPMNE
jgi:hypothetical protein